MKFLTTIVMGVALAAGAAYGATPLFVDAKAADSFKLYWLVKTDAPPVIDGKLDDAAWKSLDSLQDWGFCNYGRKDGAPGEIDFRACWDSTNLYVGARMYHRRNPEKDMPEFLRQIANVANAIFARECLEIHIDGNLDHATRFQAIVNARSERMMIWHYDFGWGILVNNDYGLDADWDVVGGVEKDCWTVELRFALRDIQVQPRVGAMFGINPCWFNWADSREGTDKYWWQFLTWSTAGDSHHDPRLYGHFLLVDEKPKDLVSGLRLAYPDLDSRTVMIQTPEGFTTVHHGQVSTLGFADKLKEEVKAARAAVEKVAALTGGTPGGKETNALQRLWMPQDEALRTIEAEVAAKPQLKAGDLRSYRAGLVTIGDGLEAAYWRVKQDLFLKSLP